jgi:hypothetical protein
MSIVSAAGSAQPEYSYGIKPLPFLPIFLVEKSPFTEAIRAFNRICDGVIWSLPETRFV